jgi:two-component system KDP operon response regulator KdpE
MSQKILIIDDDPVALQVTQTGLTATGYKVITAQDGKIGLQKFQEHRPDLVILDVIMPTMDGWETCRSLRQLSNVPILMLTGLESKGDIVKGLNLGADDYVVKPFRLPELQARVEALLRRLNMPLPSSEQMVMHFQNGELIIDPVAEQVTLRGKPLHLTPLEYNLLFFLAKRSGRIVSTSTIFDKVWPYTTDAGPESVKWYIWRLRQKLEADPDNPRYILTEHGFGNRFINS